MPQTLDFTGFWDFSFGLYIRLSTLFRVVNLQIFRVGNIRTFPIWVAVTISIFQNRFELKVVFHFSLWGMPGFLLEASASIQLSYEDTLTYIKYIKLFFFFCQAYRQSTSPCSQRIPLNLRPTLGSPIKSSFAIVNSI